VLQPFINAQPCIKAQRRKQVLAAVHQHAAAVAAVVLHEPQTAAHKLLNGWKNNNVIAAL
jgi:hypothetical protein